MVDRLTAEVVDDRISISDIGTAAPTLTSQASRAVIQYSAARVSRFGI